MLVSNASTLILLAKATILRKFLESHGPVAIPPEVSQEATGKESLDSKIIEKEIEEKRLVIKRVPESAFKPLLTHFRLDKGEAAAFALFKQTKGRILLTDDKELIKLCRVEGVPFVCALAIVAEMYKRKELSRPEAMEKLDALEDYGRYSKEVLEYFKKEVT